MSCSVWAPSSRCVHTLQLVRQDAPAAAAEMPELAVALACRDDDDGRDEQAEGYA